MNEEEIVEQFEHWIEYEKNNKEKINKADELIEIQQGLLDLYKQEKEKNKETKIIADSFHEKMAKKFDEDFIPKSKIEEKIKEINKRDMTIYIGNRTYGKTFQQALMCELKRALQELLEENRNDR